MGAPLLALFFFVLLALFFFVLLALFFFVLLALFFFVLLGGIKESLQFVYSLSKRDRSAKQFHDLGGLAVSGDGIGMPDVLYQ
jgi:hypothetical protein